MLAQPDFQRDRTMPLLHWKDEYMLGIRSLDFEHRDLFERINDLYDMCVMRGGADEVEECLGRLHARLSAHFALEEKIMHEMKTPHYAAHKAEHDRFLDEVTDAMTNLAENSDKADIHSFASQVEQWIVNHITTYDRQLVETERT